MYSDKSDSYLLERISRSDCTQAFEEIFTRNSEVVRRYFHAKGWSHHGVDYHMQEVFCRVWEKRAKLKRAKNLRAFILGFARNIHREACREKGKERELLTELSDHVLTHLPKTPESELAKLEARDTVSHALSRLRRADREIITLRQLDGHSYEEIARMIGENVSTLQTRCERARKKLARLLKEDL